MHKASSGKNVQASNAQAFQSRLNKSRKKLANDAPRSSFTTKVSNLENRNVMPEDPPDDQPETLADDGTEGPEKTERT
jgi:hypothetical protein